MIQARNVWRRIKDRLAFVAVYLLTALALVPLALVLWYTVSRGISAVSQPEFFFNVERPVGIPGAGVAHAIAGTGVMVGLASLLAIPIGVIGGIYLVEYGAGRWASWVRLAADVLVGAPSIAIGLFGYVVLVAPYHHFSGFAGAAALAVLMLPVVIRTTDAAVGQIPPSLRESGVARAAGETAPLLFTGFGNRFLNLDPTQPMSALPLIVFHDALTPYKALQDQAWGAALLLVAIVLVVNLASRFVLRRQIRLAGQL